MYHKTTGECYKNEEVSESSSKTSSFGIASSSFGTYKSLALSLHHQWFEWQWFPVYVVTKINNVTFAELVLQGFCNAGCARHCIFLRSFRQISSFLRSVA